MSDFGRTGEGATVESAALPVAGVIDQDFAEPIVVVEQLNERR